MRTICILGVLALSACNLMASGKTSLGGGGSSEGSRAAAPEKTRGDDEPAADAGDDDWTRQAEVILADENPALHALKELDAAIEHKDYRTYALGSMRMQKRMLKGGGYKDKKKDDFIQRRLDVLDALVYKSFPRLAEHVGDARRVVEIDEDAVEAANDMVKACESAAGTRKGGTEQQKELATKIAAYEKAIARVRKIDAKALRYIGNDVDVPTDLLTCEAQLSEVAGELDDEYIPEVVNKVENEKACGAVDFLIDGVQTGGGTFAPYGRTVGGNQGLEKAPCNKLAKKNKYPKAMAAAVKEFADDIGMKLSDMTIVAVGASYVEGDESDGRLHRYQKLTAYSKKFELAGNPCGSGKLFCEAGGSRGATSFNRLEHALDRAAVHAGKSPDRCRAFLKKATGEAAWFAKFRDDAIKSKDWISGATYRTKKGAKLKEKDFVAAFAQKGEQAQEMLDNKYCAKPAK